VKKSGVRRTFVWIAFVNRVGEGFLRIRSFRRGRIRSSPPVDHFRAARRASLFGLQFLGHSTSVARRAAARAAFGRADFRPVPSFRSKVTETCPSFRRVSSRHQVTRSRSVRFGALCEGRCGSPRSAAANFYSPSVPLSPPLSVLAAYSPSGHPARRSLLVSGSARRRADRLARFDHGLAGGGFFGALRSLPVGQKVGISGENPVSPGSGKRAFRSFPAPASPRESPPPRRNSSALARY